MKRTKEQYIKKIVDFNERGFRQKLEFLRDHKHLVTLNVDNGWSWITLVDVSEEDQEDIQKDVWFEWDGEAFIHSGDMWELMDMAGIV